MNNKATYNVFLGIILMALLSGCIKVEFITPGEEITNTTITKEPAITPTLTLNPLNSFPSGTPIPTPTPKAMQNNITEPKVILVPVISLLHDQFNGINSYYGYNTQLWDCWNCESINKGDDVVQFDLKSAGKYSTLNSKATWSFNDIGLVQVRFRIVEAEGEVGGAPAVFFALYQGPLESAWVSQCIMGNYSYSYHFNCLVFKMGSGESYEYITDNIDIKVGEWYTVKMEINPQTKEITYSLNNAVIGQHIPEDKASLMSDAVWFNFGVGSGQWNDSIIAEFDDVLLAQFP